MGGRGASSGRKVKVLQNKIKYRLNLQFFGKSEKYEQIYCQKRNMVW